MDRDEQVGLDPARLLDALGQRTKKSRRGSARAHVGDGVSRRAANRIARHESFSRRPLARSLPVSPRGARRRRPPAIDLACVVSGGIAAARRWRRRRRRRGAGGTGDDGRRRVEAAVSPSPSPPMRAGSPHPADELAERVLNRLRRLLMESSLPRISSSIGSRSRVGWRSKTSDAGRRRPARAQHLGALACFSRSPGGPRALFLADAHAGDERIVGPPLPTISRSCGLISSRRHRLPAARRAGEEVARSQRASDSIVTGLVGSARP